MKRRLWLFCFAFGIIMACTAQAAEGVYSAKGKRDPFMPLISGSAKISAAAGLIGVETIEEIVVEGLVQDANPKKSVVIANGTVLKEGDEVGSVKLLKIQADGAHFSVNGIEGFRPLYLEESKKSKL